MICWMAFCKFFIDLIQEVEELVDKYNKMLEDAKKARAKGSGKGKPVGKC